MKITYRSLLEKSEELLQKMIQNQIISTAPYGRFKEYQKIVEIIADRSEDQISKGVVSGINLPFEEVHTLKELREIVEVVDIIMGKYEDMSETSRSKASEKIRIVLTGPTQLVNEHSNTEARNYQFELRLAAKLIETGYNVEFNTNPDIIVEANNKLYAIECKRVTGASERSIDDAIDNAITQLIEHREGFFAGIVALDISALIDQRQLLLLSSDKTRASQRVLDELEKWIRIIAGRNNKLKKHAHDYIVSLFLNYTGPCVLPNEVTWGEGLEVMIYGKENPDKTPTFLTDFEKFRLSSNLY